MTNPIVQEHKFHRLDLWTTTVLGFEWDDAEFDAALVALITDLVVKAGDQDKKFEIRVRDLFDNDSPLVSKLVERAKYVVTKYLGAPSPDTYESFEVTGRAVVVPDRGFIQTHVERNEADLTIAYWPMGNAAGKPLSYPSNPRFVIEDPSRNLCDLRLPHEQRHSVHIGVRPGLMLVMPAHVPHHQQPYAGEKPHMQIVCNAKVKWTKKYLQERW